jgi:signal transduction histidine kinase
MDVDPQIIGVAQLVAGVVSLGFLKPVHDNAKLPGSRVFGLFALGTALWMFGLGASKFTPSYTLSMLWYTGTMLGAEVASAAWLLLALNVTERTAMARKLGVGLGVCIVVLQLLFVTNSLHHWMFGPETHVEGVVLSVAYGPGFWVHTGLGYAAVLFAEGLLVYEAGRSIGLRRTQLTVLSVAVVPALIANTVVLTGIVEIQYDITPFGYLLTAGILAVGVFRAGLLDLTPVARRTAVAGMTDAMVTLGTDDQVVDANESARELFDIGDDYAGMSATEFFGPVSEDVRSQLTAVTDSETEISFQVDGIERYFSLSVSKVGDHIDRGRVILLHDTTAQKRHEQELEMIRQVFSRVFRHNIRNELTVARGRMTVVTEQAEQELVRDSAATAIEATDRLLGHTQKAREIEQVIDQDPDQTAQSLPELVESAIINQNAGPDVTIQNDVDDINVRVVEGFQTAIENVLGNAIEHNTPPITIEIATEVDPETVALTITDDGSGIPENEVTAINAEDETELAHGSGVGLWLIHWYVNKSDGTLSIDPLDSGTRINMTLLRSQ